MTTFLVVNRALTTTRRVRRSLEAEGVDPDRILEAFTAQEGLYLFDLADPEVVILGVDLPDMGGHELQKDLLRKRPGVEIVVHTNLPMQDPRVREMVEGGAKLLPGRPPWDAELSALVRGRRDRERQRFVPWSPDADEGDEPLETSLP